MPPRSKARERPLSVGDIVSVAVRHFGEDYARTRGNGRWASDNIRDEGEVLEKKDGNVKVKFKDGEAHWFARKLLRIVERCKEAQGVAARVVVAQASDDTSEEVSAEESDEEGDRVAVRASSSDEEGAQEDDDDGWVQNDEQFIDERQRHGWSTRHPPAWDGYPSSCKSASADGDVSAYFMTGP